MGRTLHRPSRATSSHYDAQDGWRARSIHTSRLPVASAITAAGLALLLSACTGRGPEPAVVSLPSSSASTPSSTASSAPTGALGFSHCMRAHGVAEFPDPDSSGTLPKVSPQQLGVSATQLQAAQQGCASLLQPSNAQTHLTLTGMLAFARCMRSHGLPGWPDPTTDSDGQPVFDLHGQIDPDSQQSVTVSGECSQLLHPVPGQDGTVLCNGIGEAGCHHYG